MRAAAPSDRLLLDNGDELTGHLLGIADGSVKFETDVGPVDVKIARATAIVLNSARKLARNARAGVDGTERRQPALGHAVAC